MSNEHDPKEPALTKEDFFSCGWKAALTEANPKDYPQVHRAFSAAAKKADDENRQAHSKALSLLSIACSMELSSKSRNEPFKPLMQSPEGRTHIPDDFSEADIDFFAEIASEIDDPRLKARLADLVWLKRRKGVDRFPFVLMAIDAYREIPLNSGTRECWERAIVLAKSIGKGAGDRLDQIESSIIGAFESGGEGEGLFCFLWLICSRTMALEKIAQL